MKLNWDINDIKKKLEIALQSSNHSSKLKQYIYTSMLDDIGIINKGYREKINRDDFFKAYENFDYKYFSSPIFKVISYIASSLSEINLDLLNRPFVLEEPETVIRFCQSFYKRRNRDSIAYFKKIIKIPNRIHFMDDNIDNPFEGRSYIISNDDFYCLIDMKDYFQACLTTIHEFKHVENNIKGYTKGFSVYQELPSILYEMYMLDYFLLNGEPEEIIHSLRLNNIYKYIRIICDLKSKIELINNMARDKNCMYDIYENYDLYYDSLNLEAIYYILKNGCDKTLSQIVSFIVAIDIYLNSRTSDVSNTIACYIFGIYKMKPSIVDNAIKYITNELNNYDIVKKK